LLLHRVFTRATLC